MDREGVKTKSSIVQKNSKKVQEDLNRVNENLNRTRESLERKYKNIAGQDKLKGQLFTKLITDTNNIIKKANQNKENTKI